MKMQKQNVNDHHFPLERNRNQQVVMATCRLNLWNEPSEKKIQTQWTSAHEKFLRFQREFPLYDELWQSFIRKLFYISCKPTENMTYDFQWILFLSSDDALSYSESESYVDSELQPAAEK